ncbi:MAG: hypothetical protein HDT43_06275 [Ruminococcaceae bacterium]|nr:hypothetical protein [Oscillospiraceae bacterium]
MSAVGFSGNSFGYGNNVGFPDNSNGKKVNFEDNIRNTIDRLEQERDKYKKENEQSRSDLLDKKIGNIENRIENLQKRLDKLKEKGECETCKNRRYQDESDDPSVSFQSASKISKGGAEAAVRGHEYEHVNHNRAKADREGKEIVYQSVIIKHGICPECGDTYVAGGETTTVTRSKPEQPEAVQQGQGWTQEFQPQERSDERFNVGLRDMEQSMGNLLNMLV